MKLINKTIIICGIGSALEWYDFAIFGALAPFLAGIFFPSSSNSVALILTFAIFATGFLMRPLGAIYFGRIGDMLGRKAALSLTIILMACSTTLIGFAPTYSQVGIVAPVFIALMRLIQGFSASGEYPNAISLLAEISPAKKRGYYASFSMVGVGFGILLSSIVIATATSLIDPVRFAVWGWRIPFIMSAPLGVIGFYLRYKMNESPTYLKLSKHNLISDKPVIEVVNKNFWQVLNILCLFSFSNLAFYMVFVYLSSYLCSAGKISLHNSTIINAINITTLLTLIPVFGWLSDKYSRKKIMVLGILSIIFLSYPSFLLITEGNLHDIFIGQTLFAVMLAIVVGPIAAFSAEQLPTAVRSSGIALGLNIGASLFGGTAPMMSTYLSTIFKTPSAPCFYLILCGLVVLISILYSNTIKHFSDERISYDSENPAYM